MPGVLLQRQFHSPQESHTNRMLTRLPIQSLAPALRVARTPEEGQKKNQGEVWRLTEERIKITSACF